MSSCRDDLTRELVRELADKVLMEKDYFKSIDHLVRSLDSALYGLKSMWRGWSKENVRCLLEGLGKDFLPYLAAIVSNKDKIESWTPKYASLRHWLPTIEEYVKSHSNVKPINLPLKPIRQLPKPLTKHAKSVKSKPQYAFATHRKKRKTTAILIIVLLIATGLAGYMFCLNKDLSNSYVFLQKIYDSLNQSYNQLLIDYSVLEEKYRELQSQKTELMDSLATYEEKSAQLEAKRESLANKVFKLTNELTAVMKWLQNNISIYEQQINQLINEKNELITQLNNYEKWLTGNISFYEDRVTELNTILQEYRNQADEIFTIVSLSTADPSDRDSFLIQSVNTVHDFAMENFNGLESRDAIIAVFKWIQLNTYYQNDPYVLVPTEDGGYKWDNLWKLPNETIANRGGDCEDMALLAYSVLKNLGFRVWLIGAYGTSDGHVALIVEYNNEWYIVDPAGNWLNGYRILLKMDVVDTSGDEWWYWINPLNIIPSEKQRLLDYKFAMVVW